MCVTAVLSIGSSTLISGIFSRVDLYGSLDVNEPGTVTGRNHLVYWATGREIGTMGFMAFALSGLALGALATRTSEQSAAQSAILVCLIVSCLILVPFHNYDVIPVFLTLLFFRQLPLLIRIGISLSVLLIYRSENLGAFWNPLQAFHFPGSSVVTLGLTGLVLVSLGGMMMQRGAEN